LPSFKKRKAACRRISGGVDRFRMPKAWLSRTLPASKRMELDETPIKLRHRYLSDHFDEDSKELFNIPSVEVLE
jgi:hypothetical protein